MLDTLPTHILSPDTQAVLLLCGRFARDAAAAAQPLATGEYDRLAQWLVRHDLRPASLLQPAGQAAVQADGADLPIAAPRLHALLERGAALALAVESWSNKGLWVVSRSDESYPRRLRGRRGGPPILYGAGDPTLLGGGGLAIVGGRNADEAALDYTRRVATACAAQTLPVVSGGARGVDTTAMDAALEAGGLVVGMLSDSLAQVAVAGKYRQGLADGHLVLVSPYDPHSGFDVGNAMGRNRYIYGLADWALIVSAMHEKGGTWAGALEALKHGMPPVFVRLGGIVPDGNGALLARGAHAFPAAPWLRLRDTLTQTATAAEAGTLVQQTLALAEPALAYASVAPADAPVAPPAAASAVPAHTAFEAVLPLILAYLTQPLDAKTLAERLEARPTQVQDWLQQALADHQVVKVGKPACYVAATASFPLPTVGDRA